jgi:Icc-related predicted phosphoesterase
MEEHLATRRFLEESLVAEYSGPTVVVTHHAPSPLSIHDRFKGGKSDHLNAAYASNLEQLMGAAVLWVHGHTHDSFDYDMYGTRVVCNPRGYLGKDVEEEELNKRFQEDLVIEV